MPNDKYRGFGGAKKKRGGYRARHGLEGWKAHKFNSIRSNLLKRLIKFNNNNENWLTEKLLPNGLNTNIDAKGT